MAPLSILLLRYSVEVIFDASVLGNNFALCSRFTGMRNLCTEFSSLSDACLKVVNNRADLWYDHLKVYFDTGMVNSRYFPSIPSICRANNMCTNQTVSNKAFYYSYGLYSTATLFDGKPKAFYYCYGLYSTATLFLNNPEMFLHQSS
jgi:hypothetical protein